jgi:hypothetical protein
MTPIRNAAAAAGVGFVREAIAERSHVQLCQLAEGRGAGT